MTGSEELTESVHTDYGSEVTSIATLEEFQSAYSDLGGKTTFMGPFPVIKYTLEKVNTKYRGGTLLLIIVLLTRDEKQQVTS